MCAPDQVCGLLWKVPAAPHALPVLPRVHVSLQLQPPERRRVRGREQRARLPPAEGASGIGRRYGAASEPVSPVTVNHLYRDEPGCQTLLHINSDTQ